MKRQIGGFLIFAKWGQIQEMCVFVWMFCVCVCVFQWVLFCQCVCECLGVGVCQSVCAFNLKLHFQTSICFLRLDALQSKDKNPQTHMCFRQTVSDTHTHTHTHTQTWQNNFRPKKSTIATLSKIDNVFFWPKKKQLLRTFLTFLLLLLLSLLLLSLLLLLHHHDNVGQDEDCQ